MSPSSGQAWTRRIRTGYYDDIRVSDAERAEVAELLGRHYSDGRLDKQEFDERVAQAMGAKTRGDLNGLFNDLPDVDAPAAPGAAGGSGGVSAPTRPYGVNRRHRRGHPVLALIAAVIVVSVLWHAAFHLFFIPWFAVVVLVAVVLFVNRATHRRRS